jgi:hypothetical protein
MAAKYFEPYIRFGFPSFELGTGFSDKTRCQYYEALEYTGPNGTRTQAAKGDLGKRLLKDWFEEVSPVLVASVDMS